MVGLLLWRPTTGIKYISFILEVPCLILGGSWCDVKKGIQPQMLLSQINTSLCPALLLEMKQQSNIKESHKLSQGINTPNDY